MSKTDQIYHCHGSSFGPDKLEMLALLREWLNAIKRLHREIDHFQYKRFKEETRKYAIRAYFEGNFDEAEINYSNNVVEMFEQDEENV